MDNNLCKMVMLHMPTHCPAKFGTVVSTDVNCDALRDLVPFVQFKKAWKTHGGVLILLKLTLLHGCFSRFKIVRMVRNRATHHNYLLIDPVTPQQLFVLFRKDWAFELVHHRKFVFFYVMNVDRGFSIAKTIVAYGNFK